MGLSKEDALRAYATMLNTLNVQPLEGLLAEDFHYASQWVFDEISSKKAYLRYIVGKLQTISKSKSTLFAEMGTVAVYGKIQPCVVLAQDDRENLVGIVLAEVEGAQLKRLDLCMIPPPDTAIRSGEYPGRIEEVHSGLPPSRSNS